MAALLILVGVVALFWAALIEPIWGLLQDYSGQIERAERQLVSYRRVAARRSVLEAKLNEVRANNVSRTGFLESGAGSLVTARLQNELKRIIESNGGELRISQGIPIVEEAGFHRVGVKVDFQTGIDGLQKTIYALESASPYLFLDNVTIRAPESPPGNTGQPARVELSVHMDVFGYVAGPVS